MKRENNFLQGGYQLGAGSLVGMFTTTAVTTIGYSYFVIDS